MSDHEFNLSPGNAHNFIDQLQKNLKELDVSVKKSSLKELTSKLLGFSSSCAFDRAVKDHKEDSRVERPFRSNGQHPQRNDLVLKSILKPLHLSDFYQGYPSFGYIIDFSENFQVTDGPKFLAGEVLFVRDLHKALRYVLNWEQLARPEFRLHREDDEVELEVERKRRLGGYWKFTFQGEGDEQYLGDGDREYRSSWSGEGQDLKINRPDAPRESVMAYFLEKLVDGVEDLFHISTRADFESYHDDLLSEAYAECNVSEAEQIGMFEKFRPYLPLDTLLDIDVTSAGPALFERYVELDADFTKVDLLERTLMDGDRLRCDFLIAQGNDPQGLSAPSATCFLGRSTLHSVAQNYRPREGHSDESLARLKRFFTWAVGWGVSINVADKEGNTPLHYCALSSASDSYDFNEALYEHLLSLGAGQIPNNSHQTPAQLLVLAKAELTHAHRNRSRWFDEFFGL